jgi:hypothetical protein
MIVDSAEIDVCLSDDRPDRNGMKALFGKQPSARLDQALTRPVMVLCVAIPVFAVGMFADFKSAGSVDLVDYDGILRKAKTNRKPC